jgi:serine/threonine-protein kinase RsbW
MTEEITMQGIHRLGESESSPSASQSSRSVPFIELHYTLPSDVNTISPFVDQLMRFISSSQKEDESNFEVGLALREALVNAIVHGNQEDPHKHVYVTSRFTTDGEILITIQDEGQGFDVDAVADPTAQENLLRTSGRGIYLMTALMDQVRFEQKGTVVHLRRWANSRNDSEGAAI